tara:strand:+ start:3417 stop:4289 length:873 start_codon:yes stop_codon:yes gene_type:complete
MKGIVLAGGLGTRLHPLTLTISKQLLPIYDKPMIYYPISVLMLAGIRDILIISTQRDIVNYKDLLNDGSSLGINISYCIQKNPEGIAQAFILGEEFIGDDDVCLILGDNIFYSDGLTKLLKKAIDNLKNENMGTIFGYYVSDPENFGIIKSDSDGNIEEFIEKPKNPPSNYAVVGLYFYPNNVIGISKLIKPSKRGELEITSVNNEFLERNQLKVEFMGRGFAWLDTGNHDNLLQASNFIKTVEKMQGLKVGCLEEIAFNMNFIDENILKQHIKSNKNNSYAKYLKRLLK